MRSRFRERIRSISTAGTARTDGDGLTEKGDRFIVDTTNPAEGVSGEGERVKYRKVSPSNITSLAELAFRRPGMVIGISYQRSGDQQFFRVSMGDEHTTIMSDAIELYPGFFAEQMKAAGSEEAFFRALEQGVASALLTQDATEHVAPQKNTTTSGETQA